MLEPASPIVTGVLDTYEFQIFLPDGFKSKQKGPEDIYIYFPKEVTFKATAATRCTSFLSRFYDFACEVEGDQ